MLAYDMARCMPFNADRFCQKCMRYDKQKGQTWGDWTPCMSNKDSTDEGCRYIPMETSDDTR